MRTKKGFAMMDAREFRDWIAGLRVGRTVLTIQQHHTYIPDYSVFENNPDHFSIQQGMKTYHVNKNGWNDIGQHFTIFPDGSVLTGRSLEKSPAGIRGNNAHSICIENLGNFDRGKDTMTPEQERSILEVTAALCKKFSIPVNTDRIVYHHWFDLGTGKRNNGTKNNKSCPGTNFFGGNKVENCEAEFLPGVRALLDGQKPVVAPEVVRYAVVTADRLNIRKGAGSSFPRVSDREPAVFGAILRIYGEKNGWCRISGSRQHWVSKRYTREALRAEVDVSRTLNVRSGPGTGYGVVGSFRKGDVIFIEKKKDDWCRLVLEDKWVSGKYLKM